MTDGPDRRSRADAAKVLGTAPEHRGTLASTVLSVVAHRKAPGHDRIDESLLQGLCRAVRSGTPELERRALADLLAARVPCSMISERYIAEAARRLGDEWNADTASFAEVTIAMSRLQGMLREIDRGDLPNHPAHHAPLALVVVPDEEFHTLGAMVVVGQLRRRGVSVRLSAGLSTTDLLAVVQDQGFDMVLVSWANTETLDSLRKLVISMRVCMVCDAPIVVGGTAVNAIEDVEAQTGADYATSDIDEALTLCAMTVSEDGARRRAMTS